MTHGVTSNSPRNPSALTDLLQTDRPGAVDGHDSEPPDQPTAFRHGLVTGYPAHGAPSSRHSNLSLHRHDFAGTDSQTQTK